MKITEEMIAYVYDHDGWDEDMKQDILLELLEMPEQEVLKPASLIERIAKTNQQDLSRKEMRQAEIEEESLEQIMQGLGMNEHAADPMDILEAEQEIERRIALLSVRNRTTMEALCYDGVSVADYAESEGVSPDVIYKRLERIRKEMLS